MKEKIGLVGSCLTPHPFVYISISGSLRGVLYFNVSGLSDHEVPGNVSMILLLVQISGVYQLICHYLQGFNTSHRWVALGFLVAINIRILDLPSTQDANHHQEDYHFLRFKNPKPKPSTFPTSEATSWVPGWGAKIQMITICGTTGEMDHLFYTP